MPHIFVSGMTGSGKSVLLDVMITSMYKANDNIEFVSIDPKNGASFNIYDNLSNLSQIASNKVVKDMEDVSEVLNLLIDEMNSRNKIIASQGVSKNSELKQPFKNIVVVIDELADLFANYKDIQPNLEKLAQKARSAGIFLILATQTPNATIFSQTLRANIPGRIALRVVNSKASSIAIDEVGSERLLGNGDLYIKLPNLIAKERLIMPYLSNDDIKSIT
ncbi:MAG: hypothetical protein LUC34_05110 [Campylobacter sp.]|nr:hypothetical protein [Campylobacter sp.]